MKNKQSYLFSRQLDNPSKFLETVPVETEEQALTILTKALQDLQKTLHFSHSEMGSTFEEMIFLKEAMEFEVSLRKTSKRLVEEFKNLEKRKTL